ncbi:MAG: tRNA (adenosine(37)-N6)-dimethylallyltransferase MiaA, partial [Bacteroidales bacterium]|nr:tRNA (adenosine(37)-N6)-dimethylallyltransferase MiaA [Bacteroidales bacterium]
EIEKIGLTRPRDVLYDRINRRVDRMMEEGLFEEASALYPDRELAALQTVGYREIFDHIDGKTDLPTAGELINRTPRHCAKRRVSWWGRDNGIRWMEID